ncbi:MAG: MBL fold metallo-hydrolase [Acidobacteriota bacterium]
MLRKTFVALTTLTALAAVAMMLSAQAPAGGGGKGGGKAPAAPPAIALVKPGLYIVTGLGGNTSVRVGTDGVFVADTKNLGEDNYQQLIALIKTVTPLPVKFAAITHVHQDHSGNGGSFIRDGAQVWAQANLKTELVTYNPAQGKPAEPSNTYTVSQNVPLAGARIELHYYGAAHTGGDTLVYFPDLRVIHGGDVLVGAGPNCDFPNGGSAVSWIKVLDEVAKLDFDTVVPGHSAPGATTMTRAEFDAYRTKWKTFVQRAIDEVKKGTPKEGLIAAIKVDDIAPITATSYGQAGRLDPFYAELQAAK